MKAVQDKEGDKATWTVAKYLVTDFALSVEQALPLMKEWNASHCQPPWPEEELLRKLRRAEQESGQRGRLLAEALKGVADAGRTGAADGSGTPFLMEVPDFILADWEWVRPRLSSRKGRPGNGNVLMRALLYAAAFCQRSSRLCLPDVVLSQLLVQGEGTPRWPQKNWRRALRQILKRLHWEGLDLKSCSTCPAACPLHGRTDVPHRHFSYTFSNPRNFLGLLQHFGFVDAEIHDTTIFSYDFRGRESHHPDPGMAEVLNKEIKQGTKNGRLWRIYLPVWLFGPAVLKRGPSLILKALTRELTRLPGRGDLSAKTKVFPGSACAILDNAKKYVAFNGNGRPHYHGKGYKLKVWMSRSGRDVNIAVPAFWKAARRFLSDLDSLREPLGLVVGGYRSDMQKWRTLAELIEMTLSKEGRKWLAKCRLKVFAPEDYLTVWRQHFARAMGFSFIPGGEEAGTVGTFQRLEAPSDIKSALDLDHWMRQKGLTNRALSEALGVSVAQVGSQRSGARSWSADFEKKLAALPLPTAKEHSL